MRGLLIAFAASVILQLVLLFIISAMGRLSIWMRWRSHQFIIQIQAT